MSTIQKVKIEKIHPNHLRNLGNYPWIESKVTSLMRSIDEVGLWESIIARPIDTGFEIAFGHHRLEAAKRLGLTEIKLIIKELDDKEMLQYMGRENGEDYASDFLVMLNTWEACVQFVKNQQVTEKSDLAHFSLQPIDIARLLGWTSKHESNKSGQGMSTTAIACDAALKLINDGHMTRDDFKDINVTNARSIAQRTVTRMKQIEDLGRISARPNAEIEKAKETVVKGAKITARQVRDGELKKPDVPNAVEVNAYKVAMEEKQKPSPLFSVFGTAAANQLNKVLKNDTLHDKLKEIIQHIPSVVVEEDKAALRKIDFELGELSNRAIALQKKLILNSKKIVSINKLEK